MNKKKLQLHSLVWAVVAGLAVRLLLILAIASLEAFSIWETWHGSFHWAAIFAIITALNVRSVLYLSKKGPSGTTG